MGTRRLNRRTQHPTRRRMLATAGTVKRHPTHPAQKAHVLPQDHPDHPGHPDTSDRSAGMKWPCWQCGRCSSGGRNIRLNSTHFASQCAASPSSGPGNSACRAPPSTNWPKCSRFLLCLTSPNLLNSRHCLICRQRYILSFLSPASLFHLPYLPGSWNICYHNPSRVFHDIYDKLNAKRFTTQKYFLDLFPLPIKIFFVIARASPGLRIHMNSCIFALLGIS